MCEEEIRFSLNLTQCYLEVARAASGPISLQHPSGDLDQLRETYGSDPIANAIFSIVSISVIYSYLAIEARVNLSLHSVWKQRAEGIYPARKFLEIFGDEADFAVYRTHDRFRELPARFKALCEINGFRQAHDQIPQTWQQFMTLSKKARHFLVHPNPDETVFQDLMSTMLYENKQGIWVRVAEELIGFLYSEAHKTPPAYLEYNELIQIDSVRFLPEAPRTGRS